VSSAQASQEVGLMLARGDAGETSRHDRGDTRRSMARHSTCHCLLLMRGVARVPPAEWARGIVVVGVMALRVATAMRYKPSGLSIPCAST
jgi:hypothetical protein